MQKKRPSYRNKKNISIQEIQINCCKVMNVDDDDDEEEVVVVEDEEEGG